MRRARPTVLAVVGDVHAGSTVAPCPPEGVAFDDGGRYLPSKLQLHQWALWESFWRDVAAIRREYDATLGVLVNGDAVDGPGHHDTHQSISPNNSEAQGYVVDRVFSVPRACSPDWWIVVKGTEAHVGQGGEAESALARSLGAEREPETGAWSWYHWDTELYGVRINATHHGRSGGRPWTQLSALGILATEILVEHATAGLPHPHYAFRSHKHTPGDTGDQCPVRLMLVPAWQALTSHAHKVVPEKSINSTFGGYILVVHPNGDHTVHKRLYRPTPRATWVPPTHR